MEGSKENIDDGDRYEDTGNSLYDVEGIPDLNISKGVLCCCLNWGLGKLVNDQCGTLERHSITFIIDTEKINR